MYLNQHQRRLTDAAKVHTAPNYHDEHRHGPTSGREKKRTNAPNHRNRNRPTGTGKHTETQKTPTNTKLEQQPPQQPVQHENTTANTDTERPSVYPLSIRVLVFPFGLVLVVSLRCCACFCSAGRSVFMLVLVVVLWCCVCFFCGGWYVVVLAVVFWCHACVCVVVLISLCRHWWQCFGCWLSCCCAGGAGLPLVLLWCWLWCSVAGCVAVVFLSLLGPHAVSCGILLCRVLPCLDVLCVAALCCAVPCPLSSVLCPPGSQQSQQLRRRFNVLTFPAVHLRVVLVRLELD